MISRARRIRWALPVGVAVVAGAFLVASPSEPSVRALPSVTGITLESTNGDPEDAIGGRAPSVSEDGRLVAFVGAPGRKDERESTAFLRDRKSERLVQLTPSKAGMRTGETAAAIVSSDGCSVTVLTQMPLNLFADDDLGERWDVYRAPLTDCEIDAVGDGLDWELVSSGSDAATASNAVDPTAGISVSAAGTVIAYVAPSARKSDLHRVFVADLAVPAGNARRVVAVPGLPTERPENVSSYLGQVEPTVSADGSHVAFTSDAVADAADPTWSEVDEAEATPPTQVYLWNRTTDSLALVSGLPGARVGSVPAWTASQPSISGDGTRIAFVSTSTDLVAGRYPDCPVDGCVTTQVFVRDTDRNDDGVADDPELLLASRRPSQKDTDVYVAGNRSSTRPSISADGSMVAYVSRATNLLAAKSQPGSEAVDGDILVTELGSGSVRRASVRPDTASPAEGANGAPSLSATGRVVSFETSVGAQMVPGTPTTGDRQVVSSTFPMELSMPALDVGTVPPNWPSPEWFVTVTNTGSSSFVPDRVETSAPEFQITGGSCLGGSVAPGATCTVRIVFTPKAVGDVIATLTVAETGFNPAYVTTSLTGAGGEPYLSATPAGLGFDPTVVGSFTEPEKITITNTGFDSAALDTVRITGPNSDDFIVTSTDCNSSMLAPTAKCDVNVAFAPHVGGVRTGLVTVSTSAGSRTSVIISGEGMYRPSVSAPEVVQAGRPMVIDGQGYAPETTLIIGWADDGGREVAVETNARGEFSVEFPLADRERPGARELVVSDPSNVMPTTRASVIVRPDR